MKLQQLFESQERLLDYSPASVAKLIEQNCSQILNAYYGTDERLVRGEHMEEFAFKSSIRQNRSPVEMPGDAHELLHKAFLKLGLIATRKNAIFCSTNRDIANAWGNAIYTIFPYDGWSGTVLEVFDRGYAFGTLQHLVYEAKDKTEDDEERVEYLVKWLAEYMPSKVGPDNIEQILERKFEDIQITGPGYIAVRNVTFGPMKGWMRMLNKELGI